jgi:hypothetical protein
MWLHLNDDGEFSCADKTAIGWTTNTFNYIPLESSVLSSGSYYFILEDENGNKIQELVIK